MASSATGSHEAITPGLGGSPFFDDLRQDKDLRNSFLHAIALTLLAAIIAGAYYVYSVLEPFIVPLLWAVLSGVLLHPYKRSLTTRLRLYLVSLQQNDLNVFLAASHSTLSSIDHCVEFIGEYFLHQWRMFAVVFLLSTSLYALYVYTPGAFIVLITLLRDLFMTDVPSLVGSVQSVHLGVCCTLCISTLVLLPQNKLLCKLFSLLSWLMLIARIFHHLWPPLIYLFLIVLVLGYLREQSGEDEPDGEDSRIKTLLITILRRLNLLRSSDESDSPGGVDETRLAEGPVASTPIQAKVEMKEPLSTIKHGVIPHPGVSALKKEHGILFSRPNLSEIGKPSTPVGSNTPRSRLGRSFRYAKRKSSLASDIHHDSMRYIYWVLWCCGLIQLWIRPGLLHLLPGPIFYSLIKRLFNYTGAFQFLSDQMTGLKVAGYSWYDRHSDIILPLPVRFLARQVYNVERSILQMTTCHVDGLVTILLILGMVLVTALASIFISLQVYAESAYILQSLTSIASTLKMNDSMIFSTLNISLPENSSMEGVMDEAYSYGRSWISSTLRNSLHSTDTGVREELEEKVLELWDRSYQYWILKQDSIGPKMSSAAISITFGEVMDTIFHSQNIFNISAIQIFIRNNMGTLTSILEQLWSLLQGNLVFLLDTLMGVARVLLHSGSGFVNFVFGIVIYLTALFYLLTNSSGTYKPIELIGQYTPFNVSGVGGILQTAVNSVLFITVKMASFYLLWTYLTHTVFQATIVVLPMLFSSFIAAVPFTGQYIVSMPASLELWLLQGRPVASVLLMIFQVAPSWLVDAAIYSEMKGGIHPWFTGLAVVGGVYVFGVVGAVYGPLALCVLYVIVNLCSTYIQEFEPPTPTRFYKSLRTPFTRTDTIA